MQYSPSQFRSVQHEFLQQFELKSLDFYDKNINQNNFIQYKKILNQLKSKRSSNISFKQRNKFIHSRGKTTNVLSTIDKSQVINQTFDQQQGIGFYLTQNVDTIFSSNNFRIKKNQTKDSRTNQQTNQQKQNIIQSSKCLSTSKIDSKTMNGINQNLDIDQLNDKIYGQYSVLQCLKHQENQVLEAIFCFKKRIIKLQDELNTEEIKSKEVDRLLVENNNQMLRAKHTNQQVKSAFLKTKKHFDLDFDGRKQIQQKFNQKNRSQFQQSVVNHIYMKKMKKHIINQQKQTQHLDQIRRELQKKQKKYQAIYEKQQQLYKMYQEIKEISPNEFLKKPIVSILDNAFDLFDQTLGDTAAGKHKQKNIFSKCKHKKQKQQHSHISIKSSLLSQSQQHQFQKPLIEIVQEMVSLYKIIKHQQNSLISQFKLLINQRDQKQAKYNKLVQKIVYDYENLLQKIIVTNPQDKQRLEELSNENIQITGKIYHLNNSTNSFEDRLKFWFGKQLSMIQKMVDLWMKTDKVSIKYMQEILGKFNDFIGKSFNSSDKSSSTKNQAKACYQQIEEKQMCLHDSKTMLISFFQNWQDYMGFVDIMHQNSYIYRYMNKNILFKLFKRIIKTKFNKKHLLTEDIFQKAIEMMFDQGRIVHMFKVKKLLEMFKNMYDYLNDVKNGKIILNCCPNYQLLQLQEPQTQNQFSKLPSRNQLQRYSYNKDSSKQRNSLDLKTQTNFKTQQGFMGSTLPSLNTKPTKCFSAFKRGTSNTNLMKQQDLISKLKRRKPKYHAKQTNLNMHDFYQNLREQIEKVKKVEVD